MRVFWVVTIEDTYTMIMASMEGGFGPEVAMAFSVLGLTHMEDGTIPCWAWIYDRMEASAEYSTIG